MNLSEQTIMLGKGTISINDFFLKLEELQEQLQFVKRKHKKLINENSENILSLKSSMEFTVKLLDQKDEKFNLLFKQQKAEFLATIDDLKNQLKVSRFKCQCQGLNEQQRKKLEGIETSINVKQVQLMKAETVFVEARLKQSERELRDAIEKSHKDLQDKLDLTKAELQGTDVVCESKASMKNMPQMIDDDKTSALQAQSEDNCIEKTSGNQNSMLMANGVYELTIEDVEAKLNMDQTTKLYSELFSVPGYPYRVKAQAKISNKGIAVNLQLFSNSNCKGYIQPVRLLSAVTYILEDQSSDKKKRDWNFAHQTYFGKRYQYGDNILSLRFKPPINLRYIKNNSAKIKIVIPPPLIAHRFTTNNGTLLWNVDNLTKNKLNISTSFAGYKMKWDYESPYFYTSANGYKVVIWLNLGGESKLKAHLIFLQGVKDDSLSKYFRHRMTITLVNQSDYTKNLTCSKEGNEAVCTSVEIEHHSPFVSDGFVINDSVQLWAVVEAM